MEYSIPVQVVGFMTPAISRSNVMHPNLVPSERLEVEVLPLPKFLGQIRPMSYAENL